MSTEEFKIVLFDATGTIEPVLYEALAKHKVKLVSAANQEEAFQAIWREWPVNLVITNFDPGDTSEFSFIRQLRKGTGFADIDENTMPVAALNKYTSKDYYLAVLVTATLVVVSDQTSKDSVMAAMRLGARGFLTQNISGERCLETLLKASPELVEFSSAPVYS